MNVDVGENEWRSGNQTIPTPNEVNSVLEMMGTKAYIQLYNGLGEKRVLCLKVEKEKKQKFLSLKNDGDNILPHTIVKWFHA